MGRQQSHTRRRDVELEVEEAQAPVVRENAGDPAPLEQQDVAMPTAISGESTSVKCGAVAKADDEERARLRLRFEGKRSQKHDMEVTMAPRTRPGTGWSPGGARNVKARNLSRIWRKRSRTQR